MRHKYETRGIVLTRSPLGETSALITLLTPELGLVRARAQGLRSPGAKLAPALATFRESELTLVRGKEGWRISGALLDEDWFSRLERAALHRRAARVTGLLLRLVGEGQEPALYGTMRGFFETLATESDELHEAAEMLAVLHMLATLGLDAGALPDVDDQYSSEVLASVTRDRATYIARINHDLAASGL